MFAFTNFPYVHLDDTSPERQTTQGPWNFFFFFFQFFFFFSKFPQEAELDVYLKADGGQKMTLASTLRM